MSEVSRTSRSMRNVSVSLSTQAVLLDRFTDDVVRAARGAKPHERRTC